MIVALKNNLKTKMQLATHKNCDYVLMNCLFHQHFQVNQPSAFRLGAVTTSCHWRLPYAVPLGREVSVESRWIVWMMVSPVSRLGKTSYLPNA